MAKSVDVTDYLKELYHTLTGTSYDKIYKFNKKGKFLNHPILQSLF